MSSNKLNVSIILVNYNTTEFTLKCIESIRKFTLKNTYEIILIDNASIDKNISQVTETFPDIVFIANNENVGFGRANNQGIDIAKGKYVFLLNTDAFLLSDAIFSFWNFMEAKGNDTVACCGAALVDDHDKQVISYGNFPSVFEAFSSIGFFIFYKKYYRRHLHHGIINYSNKIRPVDYVCGADMFLRKKVLTEIGAFDPDFFLYFEETELSYRLSKAGYLSYIIPEIKIIHLAGGSQKVDQGINYKQFEIFSKSRSIYFEKCHGKFSAKIVKLLYAIRALVYGLVTWNGDYKKVAKLIFNS